MSFQDNVHRTWHTGYFLPIKKIKDYIVMIDEQHFSDEPVKMIWEHMITFEKNTSGQGDDYATDCLLDFKLIAIDLSKQ